MKKHFCLSALLLFFLVSSIVQATDPALVWDLKDLNKAPKADWRPFAEKKIKDDSGTEKLVLTRRVYYENVPFNGKQTRVMAFYSRPKENGRYPGIVLIHGGGGTAFSYWSELWAARGYTAIAMDLSGNDVIPDETTEGKVPRKRLPDGGPDQGDVYKFRDFKDDPNDYKNFWSYHAVAAIMHAHSLLRSLPETDPARTAATGISWGGYLSTMIAGIDRRFNVVVPVYGCGQILDGVWSPWKKKKSSEQVRKWIELFDPNSYVDRAQCRMFFVDGTDDFAYPLEIARSSWEKVPGADVRLRPAMPHSHHHGWIPKEIRAYIDSVLRSETPPPCLTPLVRKDTDQGIEFSAEFKYGTKPVVGKLWYTADPGGFSKTAQGSVQWQIRQWKSIPAKISDSSVSVLLPKEIAVRPIRVFLETEDVRGLTASTHFLLIQ